MLLNALSICWVGSVFGVELMKDFYCGLVGVVLASVVVAVAARWVQFLEVLLRELAAEDPQSDTNLTPLWMPSGFVWTVVALSVWWIGHDQTDWAVFWVQAALIGVLWLLASIDAKTGLLPDVLNALVILSGLIGVWLDWIPVSQTTVALAGYGVPWVMNWFYRLRHGVDAIGQGDAKLLMSLGLWFGWPALGDIVVAAVISSLAYTAVYGVIRRQWPKALPLGPFLALAATIQILSL